MTPDSISQEVIRVSMHHAPENASPPSDSRLERKSDFLA